MRRILAAVIAVLCMAGPAPAGTKRDPQGDTYRLDVKRVVVRHRSPGARELWTLRVETYDAFTNEQLRRNSENGMYAMAFRFETQGGRPCDRNLQIYVVRRGEKWEPHARVTGGRGDEYRKWDGGGTFYGYPQVWRPDARSITFRVRESMLSKGGLERFGWGLRTVSGEDTLTANNIYMDYAPQGRLAWEREP
jgi:hypothetical protein